MIKRFFVEVIEAISTSDSAAVDSADREAALRKATAVLMLDVARADQVFEQSELDRTLELVESHFGLSRQEAEELVDAAGDEAEDLTSVHQFTQLLHEHLNEEEKARIVSLLWQIAYAEIWVTDTLWPDFRRQHLFQALCDYQGRERRYGDVKAR